MVADAIRIAPSTNHAPAAVNDSYSANEETPFSGTSVLSNDSDVDGDSLTAVLATNPTHGSLTLNTDGTFTYTPYSGYSGSDSFTYRASDGALTSALATASITVASAPVVTVSGFTTSSDQFSVNYSMPSGSTPLSSLNLRVYRSSDGVHADGALLTTYTVDDPTRGSAQTATFAPDMGTDIEQDFFLVATADGNVPIQTNVTRFAGGAFRGSSNVLYVFGTSADDTVSITEYATPTMPLTIFLAPNSGSTTYLGSSVSEIHVRGNEGDDTIAYSAESPTPESIWAFGGDGNDTISSGGRRRSARWRNGG